MNHFFFVWIVFQSMLLLLLLLLECEGVYVSQPLPLIYYRKKYSMVNAVKL